MPSEALYLSPKIIDFFWRIENVHVREGGFALIQGDPGTGKSVVLRALAERLERQPELTVGVLNHPQSNLGDFYRELAEVFGVSLKPSNRWGGFKTLRERWIGHLTATRVRCCLLIDEAQEMSPKTLLELRLLASARFDSQPLLAVVLAGDGRLTEALARDELLPLGTRIRVRLALDYAAQAAHPPFFSGFFSEMHRVHAPETELSEPLRRFLGSPAVSQRTDDDVSLVLAVRVRQEGPV